MKSLSKFRPSRNWLIILGPIAAGSITSMLNGTANMLFIGVLGISFGLLIYWSHKTRRLTMRTHRLRLYVLTPLLVTALCLIFYAGYIYGFTPLNASTLLSFLLWSFGAFQAICYFFYKRETQIQSIGYSPPPNTRVLSDNILNNLTDHFLPPRVIPDFTTTLPGKLAVITTHFNPANYNNIRTNYQTFAERMRSQGIDLWTAEVAFGQGDFFLNEDERNIRIRTDDILWQKEPAMNVLLDSLPNEYDKVMWVDADILYEDPQWAAEVERLLEQYPVIQCFDTVLRLSEDGKSILKEQYATAKLASSNHPRMKDFRFCQPGFAWAIRREIIARHKFYYGHILGGNDALMAAAFFGWIIRNHFRLLNEHILHHFISWADRMYPEVLGHVSYYEGYIYHLWHGASKNRKYVERYKYLIDQDCDPSVDVCIGDNGLLQWASKKPELHEIARQYFFGRMEDGEEMTLSTPLPAVAL